MLCYFSFLLKREKKILIKIIIFIVDYYSKCKSIISIPTPTIAIL
jgi:hypothetical protein